MHAIKKQLNEYLCFVTIMPDTQSYVSFLSILEVQTAALTEANALLQSWNANAMWRRGGESNEAPLVLPAVAESAVKHFTSTCEGNNWD